MSAELSVLVIGMTPIGELRAAIPVGISVYGLSAPVAATYAVIGNMIPAVVIIYTITPLMRFFDRRYAWAQRFFSWLHKRTRRVFSGPYAMYGALALIIFVGIPLPMTGAWTGSFAASIFEIPKPRAVLYVLCGVLIAAAIVTALTTGIIAGAGYFL